MGKWLMKWVDPQLFWIYAASVFLAELPSP